MIKQNALISVI